jgi:hypothetical protein
MNTMKLKDCDCGRIPQVNYNINGDSEYAVVCSACGNQTPVCETISEAVSLWNQIYCCPLTLHETESV